MEAMGADVSQKIRSAIKAKLIELQAYVDDELPDYIMVMVANKKTKLQMDDDLFLFLGTQMLTLFTRRLNQVLERLQSVTADVTMKKKILVQPQLQAETVTKQPRKRHSTEELAPNTMEEQLEAEELDVQDEILAIKAELDPDDLLTEELEENDEVIDVSLAKVNKRQHVAIASSRNNPTQKAHSTSISKNGQHSPRGIKRSSAMTSIPRKRKAPSSMVGAIVTRDREDDDDEIHTGALASVVKVSERRSSIPINMQANKNLIMKAVAEAKKSVLEAARKQSSANVRKDDEFGMQSSRKLFTRKHRAAGKQSMIRTDNTLDILPVPEVYEDENGEMGERLDVDSEAISRTANETALLRMVQDERGVNESFLIEEDESRRHFVEDDDEEMRVTSPRFIVTLDGVDIDSFAAKYKFPSFGAQPMDQDDEDEDNFIMTQDSDFDLHDFESDIESVKVPADNVNKNTEKCKYWPKCKNGYQCLYHHPNKPCKTFPNCRFGEKCLYIHPNCKYGAKCAKNACPYTHARVRIPPSNNAVSRPPVAQREIKCKFFPNCSNMSCKFYHPKPCRYGLSCTQSGCTFYHPPLPSRDKLKWSSTLAIGDSAKN